MGPIVRLVSLILVLGTWFLMSDSQSQADKAAANTMAQAASIITN